MYAGDALALVGFEVCPTLDGTLDGARDAARDADGVITGMHMNLPFSEMFSGIDMLSR